MKTFKEILFELDVETLKDYFYHDKYYRASEYENKAQDLTLKQLRQASDKYLDKLLKHLKKLTPKKLPHKKTGVLFGIEHNYEPAMSLVYIGDLIEKEIEAECYAYELVKQEEILSYYVAETDYTKHHIYSLVVDALWEMTFFGIKQEKLDKFMKGLDESIKEADEDYKKYTVIDRKKIKKISGIYRGEKLIEDKDLINTIENSIYEHKVKKEIAIVMRLLRADNL